MSQHDFNIANQSFPATRTDINDAILAIVSNSSGDTEPSTTYANQWWYETDTNILKIRNEANNGWVDVITLDASMTASASELNQLDAITRGSILYGNASGETARLAAGGASTVLTSDGTDISWAAAAGGGGTEFISTSGAISSAGSVVFTGFDDSKYNNYFFMFNNVLPASADTLYCQTSIDGGSNFATTNGDYHRTGNTDATGMLVAENMQPGNPTTYGASGRFELYQPTNANNYTYSATYVLQMDNALRIKPAAVQTTLNYQNSARIAEEDNDAVRFLFIGGSNIASGEIAMYGIKKA